MRDRVKLASADLYRFVARQGWWLHDGNSMKQHVYAMKYLRNKIPFVRTDNSAENGFKKLQLAVQLVAQFYFSGLDNINLFCS